MLFKSPLGCIHQSARELCTTPDKRINRSDNRTIWLINTIRLSDVNYTVMSISYRLNNYRKIPKIRPPCKSPSKYTPPKAATQKTLR